MQKKVAWMYLPGDECTSLQQGKCTLHDFNRYLEDSE